MMENDLTQFEAFSKIARYSRQCVITEKLDGTNASVIIAEDGTVRAASRTRLITPQDDNYGFARWVSENENELRDVLGVGRHFGEWWGCGIQRRYGMTEKRFSLFNVARWGELEGNGLVHVVPTLCNAEFGDVAINAAIERLRTEGSLAAPGFMQPEGIVIYHTHSRGLFKKTLEKDEIPKGMAE